jgi:hypothetical protein
VRVPMPAYSIAGYLMPACELAARCIGHHSIRRQQLRRGVARSATSSKRAARDENAAPQLEHTKASASRTSNDRSISQTEHERSERCCAMPYRALWHTPPRPRACPWSRSGACPQAPSASHTTKSQWIRSP